MKKIYTKPSLLAEKFAVEDIMTDIPTTMSGLNQVYVDGNEINGAINFTNLNTLTSINYADFK